MPSTWAWLAVAVVPWSWFAVRDAWAPLDAVAVGLPVLGLAGLLVGGLEAARSRRALPLAAGFSCVVAVATAVLAPRFPQDAEPPARPIRFAVANVHRDNGDAAGVVGVLREQLPDVLVAIEMPPGLTEDLERTAPELVHSAVRGEIGVWSRWRVRPQALPSGLPDVRLFRVRVEAEEPFVLYAFHARNPLYEESFADQRRLDALLAAAARDEDLPVVLAGDFNLSDRAGGYRSLTGSFRDAMRAGRWANDTYDLHVWRALLLRIDHLFVPADWCADGPATFDVPGSDHEGIAATVGPC
jgi:endonuclease/exonuclease/phosphatase (EEP) superfamily protein YafD